MAVVIENRRNHSDGLRRRRILALARTFWARTLDINLPALGKFFDELYPCSSELDHREITWDEISAVILETLTTEVAGELPETIPMALSRIFDFACAARAQWMAGYEVFVVPTWADEVDPLAPPQGYVVYGIYQQKSSHLLGYALNLDAVMALLASKHLEIPAWYPCADRDYELVFDRPGPAVQQAIAYCTPRMENAGYYAF